MKDNDSTRVSTHEYYEVWVKMKGNDTKFSVSEDRAARWAGIELRIIHHEMKQFRSINEIIQSVFMINQAAKSIRKGGLIDWDDVTIHKHTVTHITTEGKLKIAVSKSETVLEE